MTAAEFKKYEADASKLNAAINNGLAKVVDGKVNDQEVEAVIIEKNISQLVKVEKEKTTWKEVKKTSFDLYVDLSIQALRLFVFNYSKTL